MIDDYLNCVPNTRVPLINFLNFESLSEAMIFDTTDIVGERERGLSTQPSVHHESSAHVVVDYGKLEQCFKIQLNRPVRPVEPLIGRRNDSIIRQNPFWSKIPSNPWLNR